MSNRIVVKRSVAAVAMALASVSVVHAQQADQAPVQKVYVTGSNIKRADKEGTSPVTTMTAKEIAATGANTVAELLHSIPAFGTGTSNDISDNSGSFSKGASTASMRNLGSSSTLVLLNGRRIAASAYADPNNGKSTTYDLNNIPVSAIERVEVFKDGASAVYGSDAIAGVINFITKTDYQGATISASTSANDNGQFNRNNVNGVVGFGDLDKDRYNAFISFDLGTRGRTGIKDVNDINKAALADVNNRLNQYSSYVSGSPFFFRERTPGAKNFSTNSAYNADIINRTAGCDPSQLITGDIAKHNLTASSMLVGRQFCNFDLNDYYEAQGKGNDANVLSKLTVKLGENLTSFTELGFTRNERNYTGAPRSLNSVSPTTVFRINGLPTSYQLILPAGHPDNPWSNSNSAVAFRMVGTNSNSTNVNTTYRFLTGLKGTAGNWDWETGLLVNRTERDEKLGGFLYRPVIDRIVTENRTIAATIADPNAVRNLANKNYSQVNQIDAKGSTTLGTLAGGDIGLAVGGEIRQEKIGLTSDPELAAGNIIGLSNSVMDGRRIVKSGFVELRTPFTKDFEMDFAGRYDKYPTAKSFVPKVGAKWTVSDQITFRSTFAKGFRAPALTQVSPGGVQTFNNGFVDTVRCPDGTNPLPGADKTDCSKSISSVSTPNPELKNETSKSFSFGAILNPTKNLDVLVDYYKIRKENETALLSASYVVAHPELFPGLAIRDTNPANLLLDANGKPIPGTGPLSAINRTYVNQGSTETSGLDFEVAHRLSLGENGRLTTRLNYSYTLSFKRAERPGETEANVVGYNGGLSDWATSVGDIPRHRGTLSTTWTRDVHSVTGSVDYVSPISLMLRSNNNVTYPVPMCYYGTLPAGFVAPKGVSFGGLPKYNNWVDNCSVAEWVTFNVAYTYTGFKNWTLSANVKNLFDTPAPYDPRNATEGFNTQLHNGMGRYFRLTASYQFK
ncbi:TonB-dependent receptor domain-containing protein [Massilia horti]|uniref:TonB-dependent receptor n=1 Tax=Massilia horti TaxID=2562153 RepID=A0A4Y9SUZ4_9BURK|nr:TonB-dependent receptor [Massilia horti]TFW30285.1 TonB-dependent receptor [Massilia horti]